MEETNEQNVEASEVFTEGQEAPNGMTIENTLNKSDELPFGFYNPDTDGKVTWVCNYGPKGDIISVFACDLGTRTDKRVAQLKDMKEALFCRDELIKNGWRPLIPPKINFTTTKEDGTKSEMNRSQRRALEKKMKAIGKTVNK